MADEADQEELLRRQKENCVFCKIIAGGMDSKEVFKDERMTAVLDIRPAAKGHTLVMPNEHYPIMPVIPPEEFAHLFGRAAPLSKAIKEGALTPRCTLFVANGPVAGQQSPHFLFHIIPREEGDGLERLDVEPGGVNQSDIAELLKNNLYSVMRDHLTKSGRADLLQVGEPVSEEEAAAIEQPKAKPAATPPKPTQNQLAQIIEQNPDIKALLINNPEKLEAIIAEQPEFQQLFQGVDIRKLGAQLRQQAGLPPQDAEEPGLKEEAPASGPEPENPEAGGVAEAPAGTTAPGMKEEAPAGRGQTEAPAEASTSAGATEATMQPPEATEDITPASQLTLEQLFAFIDSKEKLRQYILEAPEKLKELIPNHPRLKAFFAGSDVDAIISAYRARNGGGQ